MGMMRKAVKRQSAEIYPPVKGPNDILTCPDTIRVFGRTYLFNYERAGGLGQARCGSCDNILQVITIDENQSLIEEADTVLHEVLHAITYTMKLGLDPETEERVVSALATGLLGVLQDNPEFARWLIEDKSAHPKEPYGSA